MKLYVIILGLFVIGLMIARYIAGAPLRRHFGPGLFAGFALVTLGGIFLSNPLIYLGLCFLAFFIALKNRLDAACRFLLLTALTPNIVCHLTIGPAYLFDLTPMNVYSIGLACSFLVFRHPAMPNQRRFGSEEWALIALSLILIFGVSRNLELSSTRLVVGQFLQLLLPYFLVTHAIRDRGDLRIFMASLVGAAVILAVIACYEARFGWSLFDGVWRNLGTDGFLSRNLRVRAGLLRAPTTFMESTSFAMFQMCGMIAAIYSRSMFRSPARWALGCGVVATGLLAAQSRGALIGLMIGVFLVLIFRRSYGKAIALITTAGVTVYALLLLAQSNSRLSGFVSADAAYRGEDYRQRLLRRGLEEGMKNFWLGDEIGHVQARLADLIQGEHIIDMVNAYLNIFLVSGVIGLAAMLLLVMAVFISLWRQGDPRRDQGIRMLQACVVGTLAAQLVALGFTSLYERNPFWLVLTLASANILLRREAGDRPIVRKEAVAEGGLLGAVEPT